MRDLVVRYDRRIRTETVVVQQDRAGLLILHNYVEKFPSSSNVKGFVVLLVFNAEAVKETSQNI